MLRVPSWSPIEHTACSLPWRAGFNGVNRTRIDINKTPKAFGNASDKDGRRLMSDSLRRQARDRCIFSYTVVIFSTVSCPRLNLGGKRLALALIWWAFHYVVRHEDHFFKESSLCLRSR